MTTDCETLHARAEMLRHEAELGLSKAEACGPDWIGYSDQVDIALRCESLALQVDARIEEEC